MICIFTSPSKTQPLDQNLFKLEDVLERELDYGVLTPELITSRGYKYEIHFSQSKDGFQNALHRIVNPRFMRTRSTVLMFHGDAGGSNNFLDTDQTGHIDDPEEFIGSNLGFELAKRGHDVWLLDQRATPFSSNNTYFKWYQKEYWDWSLDEIALLDLPAAIDYVRNYTGRKQIGYIGYSQGNLVMLMLLSRVHKYNEMIKPFVALGPVFYFADSIVNRLPFRSLIPFKLIEDVLKKIGGKFSSSILTKIIGKVCKNEVTSILLCKPISYLFLTYGSFLINPILPSISYKRLPVYVSGAFYYTASNRMVAQYTQFLRTNRITMTDYSPSINFQLYGTEMAPLYDPGRINCKFLALFSSMNDVLASPKDVQQLRETIKVPLLYDQYITDPEFGHSTFVLGTRDKIIPYIIKPVLAIFDKLY